MIAENDCGLMVDDEEVSERKEGGFENNHKHMVTPAVFMLCWCWKVEGKARKKYAKYFAGRVICLDCVQNVPLAYKINVQNVPLAYKINKYDWGE